MGAGPAWTEREVARLVRLVEQGYTYGEIGQQLGRTQKAINQKMKTMAQKDRIRRATMTLRAATRLFGLVDRRALSKWVDLGWLPARRDTTGVWRINKEDLYRFLQNESYWFAWEPTKITDAAMRQWALAMREGKPRWLTVRDVATRYGVTIQAVQGWIGRGCLATTYAGRHYIHERDLIDFVPPYNRTWPRRKKA